MQPLLLLLLPLSTFAQYPCMRCQSQLPPGPIPIQYSRVAPQYYPRSDVYAQPPPLVPPQPLPIATDLSNDGASKEVTTVIETKEKTPVPDSAVTNSVVETSTVDTVIEKWKESQEAVEAAFKELERPEETDKDLTIAEKTTYLRPLSNTEGHQVPYRPQPLVPPACAPYVQQAQNRYSVMPYYPSPYAQPQPAYRYNYQPLYPQQPARQVQPEILPVYVTTPRPQPLLPPPLNDCCGRCHSPCRHRQRRASGQKTFGERQLSSDATSDGRPRDSKCTSDELRAIMLHTTTRTATLSKRLIQKAAEEQFGGYFSVICGKDDFSYVSRSDTFCQTEKNDVVCYAFKHN